MFINTFYYYIIILDLPRAQFGGDLSWMTSDKGDQDSSLMSTMNGTTSPEAAVIIHELTESERQADMTFKRLCLTIDQMLYEAKQALDQSSKPAGVKVLSSFDMCKLTPRCSWA